MNSTDITLFADSDPCFGYIVALIVVPVVLIVFFLSLRYCCCCDPLVDCLTRNRVRNLAPVNKHKSSRPSIPYHQLELDDLPSPPPSPPSRQQAPPVTRTFSIATPSIILPIISPHSNAPRLSSLTPKIGPYQSRGGFSSSS